MESLLSFQRMIFVAVTMLSDGRCFSMGWEVFLNGVGGGEKSDFEKDIVVSP
jgi:hypothetical protein